MKFTRKKLLILLLVLLPGVLLDQLTKIAARKHLATKSKSLIKDVLELRLLHNSGAVWGSFQNSTLMLTVVSIILVIALLYFYFKIPDEKKMMPLMLSLAFIICGAIGNIIDRIVFKYVTDFIFFSLINFPIFNVADVYVTCATILLALLIIFYYKDEDFEWKKKQ